MYRDYDVSLTEEEKASIRENPMDMEFFERVGYARLAEKIGLTKFEFEGLLFKKPAYVAILLEMPEDELDVNLRVQERLESDWLARDAMQKKHVLTLDFGEAAANVSQWELTRILEEHMKRGMAARDSLAEDDPRRSDIDARLKAADLARNEILYGLAGGDSVDTLQSLIEQESSLRRLVADYCDITDNPNEGWTPPSGSGGSGFKP